jgi:hypothetical protein
VSTGQDMESILRLTAELDRRKQADYTVTGHFKTASGQTDASVSKNNNLLTVVLAIVAALVILFLLLGK